MDLWPNQIRSLEAMKDAHQRGVKRLCIASPTGSGKSVMMVDGIEWALAELGDVSLYAHRRMLLEQLRGVLKSHNIDCGMRASGHEPALLRPVQLCMVQTEGSQVIDRERRDLHPAKAVFVDEAHVNSGPTMQELLRRHEEQGAIIIGFSATPLDIGHVYDELFVAATNSDMRACGAIVPCRTYGCDEPDLRKIKNYRVGEDLSDKENAKAIMRPGVFGRVFDWWKRLNPDARPSILFGPDVAGSIYFAEQFEAAGVPAAHIDSKIVYVGGKQYPTSERAREDIMEASREGHIKIVCNRFVLREGIDAPWLEHAIFATVFGALTSCIQAGGRLLRQYFIDGVPQLNEVTLQDHGGNWWRHGSINADREWRLDYTNHIVSALRAERMRQKTEPEPICCINCGSLRLSGPTCSKCGQTAQKRSRSVVQIDGALREMKGDIFKPRKVSMRSDTQARWDRYYFGARKKGRTFAQAEAFFFHEEHYWPPRTLANMPTNDVDWFRSAADVPRDQLIRKAQVANA